MEINRDVAAVEAALRAHYYGDLFVSAKSFHDSAGYDFINRGGSMEFVVRVTNDDTKTMVFIFNNTGSHLLAASASFENIVGAADIILALARAYLA